MSDHTPGPWAVHSSSGSDYSVIGAGRHPAPSTSPTGVPRSSSSPATMDRVPDTCAKEWCEIRGGRDYLTTAVEKQDIIITNPPYSLALEFLRKSLGEADTVVYLLRLNFLGSVARKPFWDEHPPTHLFTITPRPRFVNGGSDSCEYGWFIWDRGGRVLTDRRFLVL